jgi:isoquinoline 1-oxidoreductase beta subunit
MMQNNSKIDSAPTLEGIAYQGLSRRAFLMTVAGAGVGVAFGSALGLTPAFAQGAGAWMPNAWVRVGSDGSVTVMSPAVEMGQGIMTALPLLVAEEMDLDWAKVKIEQAPLNPKVFGNRFFGGVMHTASSRSVQEYYAVMRLAGLQARQILMAAAAEKWGVPVADVSTEPHAVVHGASGRRIGYGEIAAFATVPAEPPMVSAEQLKPMQRFCLIGKDVPRVDVPDKVAGKAVYGIDVRLPGMLYAAVLRPPVQGEKPLQIDDGEAKKVPGVLHVVPMPYGVGVIAESYPAAVKSKAALKVEWSSTAKARSYSSDRMLELYAARARDLNDASGIDYIKKGDAKGAIAGAAKTLSAEYTAEHLAHVCMEPMNATARIDGDKVELWSPTQGPSRTVLALNRVLGIKPENVSIHVTQVGGGFGRRADVDYALDAAILANAVKGTPVKVIWSREDDVANDKFRPLVAQHLSAGLDAQGNVVALRHRIVAESVLGRVAPELLQRFGGRDASITGGAEINYGIANHLVEYLQEQRGVDVGLWRAVGAGYTEFAIESFIDELAAAAGRDPLDFRLALLAQVPRAQAVLTEVAAMADRTRKRPAGQALGLAYARNDLLNSHSAQIAEVSVNPRTGRIRVHEVWCAVDCGVALQPNNIKAQVETGVLNGISAALIERITIKSGVVQQSNFHDYPVLRMNETPPVHVTVMVTDNPPGGVGELGVPPIAPAIANAVAALTGKRLRALPFDSGQLKKA